MSWMAVVSPLPSSGRVTPRWSVAGAPELVPASIDGLPVRRAWVEVKPPLLARLPKFEVVAEISAPAEKPHVPSLFRLLLTDVIVPEQLLPLPPFASKVLVSVSALVFETLGNTTVELA